MPDAKPKIQKAAPAEDAYFRLNHPQPDILVISQAEAARALAARFEQYRQQLNATTPRRKPRDRP